MPREWEQYIKEQEEAAGPEDDSPPVVFECKTHGEKWTGSGFCGTCYVEEIQEGERLAAEWKRTRTE